MMDILKNYCQRVLKTALFKAELYNEVLIDKEPKVKKYYKKHCGVGENRHHLFFFEKVLDK